MIYFIGNKLAEDPLEGDIAEPLFTDEELGLHEISELCINGDIKVQEYAFMEWLKDQRKVQFDVETNVTNSIVENRLRVVQIGEVDVNRTPEDEHLNWYWVLEWDCLMPETQQAIFDMLEDEEVEKFIQNGVFEYGVFRNYGIRIQNIVDTMVREKIIYAGNKDILDEDGIKFFSLESICSRRLNLELNKSYQTRFGEEFLTKGHIRYAAQDVIPLDLIWKIQETTLRSAAFYPPKTAPFTYLNDIPTLENYAVKVFGEISWNGLKLDTEKWIQNAEEAQPIVDTYLSRLNKYLYDDEILNARAIKLGYINVEDKLEINWNSPAQKRQLLEFAFPEIPGTTKAIINKYLKDNPQIVGTALYKVLVDFMHKDYEELNKLLVEHCKDELIKMGFFIPKGTLNINWNSWQQTLPLLQAIKPSLKSTAEKELNKIQHPIAFAFLDYRGSKMLTTTFGKDFLQHCDADGKVRTRFNQILETGRISSADPNMQQIPLIDSDDEDVMNKYRSCFIVDEPGWVFVDSDYSS